MSSFSLKGEDLSISRDHSTAMKGILILLVVFGHNLLMGQVFNHGFYDWVYSFHVSSFFLLPFFYSDHRLSLDRIKVYAKRLLWPYLYLFFALFFLHFLISKNWNFDVGMIRTFIAGDFYKISYYTGFQYIWFLPAMFSLLVLKDAATSANNSVRIVMFLVSVIFFLVFWIFLYHRPYPFVVNTSISQVLPLSVGISLAMLFLGYVTKAVLSKISIHPLSYGLIMIVALIVLLSKVNDSYYNTYVWIFRFVCPIAGFAFLFRTTYLYNCTLLREVGKLSLPIYVFHQPLNYFVCSLLQKLLLPSFLSLIVSFLVVIISAYFLSKTIYSINWLKQFLFPN